MIQYRVSNDVLLRDEEDGGIALDTRTGQMLGLNQTAYQLMQWLIREPTTLNDLVSKLNKKYKAAETRETRGRMREHIEEFLSYLKKIKILEKTKILES